MDLEKTLEQRFVVEMRGIVKRFPGVLANDHVDFDLQESEIHALLGENGAGKSTLMSVLAGLYRPQAGTIRGNGKIFEFLSPRDTTQAGIVMLYRGAEILIMDEPTALLGPQEIEGLFKTLRSMIADGKSVIFISHKLQEVMAIADRITVLRKGKVTAAGLDAHDITRQELARQMVGRDVVFHLDKKSQELGSEVLTVQDIYV